MGGRFLLRWLPTVVSPGAIWTEIEAGFHIELETAVRIDVLPSDAEVIQHLSQKGLAWQAASMAAALANVSIAFSFRD